MSEPGLHGQPIELWEELLESHALALASLTESVRALMETQADILDMVDLLASEVAELRQLLEKAKAADAGASTDADH